MSAERVRADFAELANIIRNADNPFDVDKVEKARDNVVDVPTIHEKAFRSIVAELERVRSSRKSRGVLLTGVAGSGKSHLISRLFCHRPENVLFFQVQALPGGTAWFRHILQCIVSDLEQPMSHEDDTPQLIWLIRHFIDGVREKIGAESRGDYGIRIPDRALRARLEEIHTSIPHPAAVDVVKVLVNLWKWEAPFRKRKDRGEGIKKKGLAIQWLKGTMIEDEELAVIGAKSNLEETDQDGLVCYLAALRVFGLLTVGQAPIVLVFDQLDTMEPHTVNSLGNQLLQLIGSESAAPNYLLVTAGVGEQVDGFIENRIIPKAVADVVFKTRLQLPALDMDQSLDMVAARLARLFGNEPVPPLPHGADRLFPFTGSFLQERLKGPIKPVPRDVLQKCRTLYDEIAEEVDTGWLERWPDSLGKIMPPTTLPTWEHISSFLQKELEAFSATVALRVSVGPVDGDLLADTLHRLLECAVENRPLVAVPPPPGKYPAPADSFFCVKTNSDKSPSVGIVFNNKGHHTSVGAVLKKCRQFLAAFGSDQRMLFGRDNQAKSMEKWKSCQDLIRELEATGRFELVRMHQSEIRRIQALDKLRRAVPDLVMPASRHHGSHKVTDADFTKFLCEPGVLDGLQIMKAIENLVEKQIGRPVVAEQTPAGPALSFVLSRITARKMYGFETLVSEWARLHNRARPNSDDRAAIEMAVETHVKASRMMVIGSGEHKIVKKA